MGLFNRNDNDRNIDESDLDLPTQDDFHQPLVEEPRPTPTGRYSIEDAIQLMRQLPTMPDDQMMEIICKTLESAKIKTADVLQDANQKEQRIRRENSGIEKEIANLQAQIDERQRRLQQMSETLEELMEIKARFEAASGKTQVPSGATAQVHEEDSTAETDEQGPAEASAEVFEGTEAERPHSFSEDFRKGFSADLSEPEDLSTPISAGRRGRGAPR